MRKMKKILFILGVVCFFIHLFVYCAFATDVTLQWAANTEPDLAGYNVYHGVESGVYNTPIWVGDVTEYTMTGLQAGVFHFFVVTAVDNEIPALESDYSNEVMCADGIKPGMVINININCR